jgi:hypothetical protein
MDIDFAVAAAGGADTLGPGQFPGPRLEFEGFGNHRAGRADLNAVAAKLTELEMFVDKGPIPLVVDVQGA